jgi:hypothetical protein
VDVQTLPTLRQWRALNLLTRLQLRSDAARNCSKILDATCMTYDELSGLIDNRLVVGVHKDGSLRGPGDGLADLPNVTLRILPAGTKWVTDNPYNRVLSESFDRQDGHVTMQLMRHIARAADAGPDVFAKLVSLRLIRVRASRDGEVIDADRTAKPLTSTDTRYVALTMDGARLINPT